MARNLPAITDDDIPEATSSFHDMILRASARINDREKLAEYTKAHGTDRPFLTIEDERDLTRAAVARFDVDFDSARWLTSGILMENGVALERDLDKKIEHLVRRFAKTGKRITRQEFKDAVATYRSWAQNAVSESEVQKKLKSIIEDEGYRVGRSGIFRTKRWFNKIPSD